MDYKSPQQQIFDAVFKASLKLGYATFDYLPADKVGYPFVYIGERFDQDRKTKQHLYGDVQQRIHIYHDYKKRRELTDMMDKLKTEIRRIKHTENFYITVKGLNSQTLLDTTTSNTLLHGILEVDFTFN